MIMITRKIQVVETYETFGDRLLDVNFRWANSNEASLVRTCRSTYYGLRQMLDGCLTPRYEQMEFIFKVNGHSVLSLPNTFK